MSNFINYTTEGKILGFTKGDTDLNIEVSNAIWFEAQGYNKIIIDGDNISFNKVDWRTVEEIEKERISSIKAKANELIEMVYPIYKQNNILMSQIDEDIKGMNAYILNIRNISNEAEINGTALEDIVWN